MSLSKGMTVMQVLPALHSGGVERGTVDLVKALTEAGHRALVISSGGPLTSQIQAAGGRHFTLPVHSKNPVTVWRNAARIAMLASQEQTDLLHVRSRAPAWSCLQASRLAHLPYVTTFHGQYGHASRIKRFYNSAMLRGSACIAVSDFIARHIHQVYGDQGSKVTTIYRGIDTQYFDPETVTQERISALKTAWNLPETKDLVITLPGRLTRLKGHRCFLNALKRSGLKSFTALVVGSSEGRREYLKELKTLRAELNLDAQVHFTGACDDMPALYAMSNIIVSASTKPEAFGRTNCEAQAMHKIVVASDHGGSRETLSIQHGHQLCTPNDPEAMGHALRTAAQRLVDFKNQGGPQSRDFIIENYSLERMTSQTLALYNKIIATHQN